MTPDNVRTGAEQRFGRVVDRQPLGAGPHQVTATYYVRDDDTGETHGFDYSDIVTEGFRTVIVGERLRFETDPTTGRAHFVIRLDLPEVDEFYR
ncbi:hypothetical protein I6A84_04445 [Frankia sp. CNm7]|uniref:Uncharacterized protein n=1 Tax=Frankia nepalensis TaxID=1836974 RepID=A0A937UNG3_9ACTN|nr:hypothetical protein [Frankia nepalensis]MBL7498744.1 hypothetical protein [Frankia nepalensis]MBL7508391.1 hypothetical protein [Frankia nepalensis]MBL7517391.1 hypothetical protein [Frankia nepalensis]MBL7626220.1 hypothetical protein [Frankia nepalensis]